MRFLPVFPEGTRIRIDSIRRILKSLGQVKLSGPERQIIVILDAGRMGNEAANALLKGLEEPPPGRIFLLINPGKHPILPTIRSRCQSLLLPSLRPAFQEASDLNRAIGRMTGWHGEALKELDPDLMSLDLVRFFKSLSREEAGLELNDIATLFFSMRLDFRVFVARRLSALKWLKEVLIRGVAGSRDFGLELSETFLGLRKGYESRLKSIGESMLEDSSEGFHHWLFGGLKRSGDFENSKRVFDDLERLEDGHLLASLAGVFRDVVLPDAEGQLLSAEYEVVQLMRQPFSATDLASFSQRLVTARSMLYNQQPLEQVLDYLAVWLLGRLA